MSTPASHAKEHQRAAEAAEAVCGWTAAVEAYERALEALSESGDAANAETAALLTALGRSHWYLGEARPAWRTLRRAISQYEQLGDPVGAARATIQILRIWGPRDRLQDMAETALVALGDADPYLRARLLVRLGWFDDDHTVKFEEAMAIAERHGFEDILAIRIQENAWLAYEDGRVDDHVTMIERAHDAFARLGEYDEAAVALREAGLALLDAGRIDDGLAMASRAADYAGRTNMRFAVQLGLMDIAGVYYGRGEYDECQAVLARSPGDLDFRADLYRMWIAQARGDMDQARGFIVDPERAGRATTGLSQTYAGAAGLLYALGNHDAAAEAMRRWAEQSTSGNYHGLASESPALLDCIIALGDDELIRSVYDAFRAHDERSKTPRLYGAMQGRALAPVLGAVCERLGLIDEAADAYRDGLGFCEAARFERDAELCRAGLARVRG